MDDLDALRRLAIALAIGLIIGVERGWHERDLADGQRVAGIRTFGLLGLLGGVAALLAQSLGGIVVAAAVLAIAAMLVVGYWRESVPGRSVGATTAAAGMLTVLLGALAGAERPAIAAAAAVVLAILLQLKPVLHGWLRRIDPVELLAALQLLLISVVVLPFLPDQGFGPGGALNPYRLWWMVVLICGLSFAGYVVMRWLGAARGVVAVGLFGGLVSSTAVTLSLARWGRAQREIGRPLAAGIVLACIVMLARIAVIAAVVAPGLALALAVPLAAAALVGVVAGVALLWRHMARVDLPEHPVGNPMALAIAVQFAAVLAIVLALSAVVRERLGDAGLNGLAVLAGLVDVDAITLSVSGMVRDGMTASVAVRAVLLAAATNTVVKAGIAVVIAGGPVARIVAAVSAAMLLAGAVGFLAMPA